MVDVFFIDFSGLYNLNNWNFSFVAPSPKKIHILVLKSFFLNKSFAQT